MTMKTFIFDGAKASLLWDEETTAWTYFNAPPKSEIIERYRAIPTLFRAIGMNANAVSTMPFKIYKGKTEVDTSQDYQNKVAFLPNPRRTFSMISMSLDLAGKTNLRKAKNQAGFSKDLPYCAPHTITPKFDDKTGTLTGYVRTVNGKEEQLKVEDIIHWWLPDPNVEIGPPTAYPAQVALSAANVLGILSGFVSMYFERGAVRPIIVSVQGAPSKEERERMESWFNKLMGGIKRAFTWKVFNADAVSIQQIGDGLDQLRDVELTEMMKKDIAQAVGIPYALLFSEAASYATLEGDRLGYYENTVEPRCEFIAAGLNDDLLTPLGYKLEFTPESLDIYQEDEEQRSGSLSQLVDSGVPLLMAMDILGYELTDEQRAQLKEEEKQKEENADEMAERLASTPKEEEQQQQPPPPNPAQEEMAKWRRKATKAVTAGKSAAVRFESDIIPFVLQGAISGALEDCKTADEVDRVFMSAWNGYP